MEDRTQEFLDECKKAGYEQVTIFIRDKRVPQTMKIKDGEWFGQWAKRSGPPGDKGEVYEMYKHRVVCGCPERIGEHPTLPGNSWPLMWGIVINLNLSRSGGGCGDAHNIDIAHLESLKAGYYDLTRPPPSAKES